MPLVAGTVPQTSVDLGGTGAQTGHGAGLIGGFLIGLGILALVYAPGQLMKTPVDVDSVTTGLLVRRRWATNGLAEPVKGDPA